MLNSTRSVSRSWSAWPAWCLACWAIPFLIAASVERAQADEPAAAAEKAETPEKPEPGEKPAAVEKADAKEPAQKPPIAAFVTVSSPVEDVVFSRVKNTVLDLQNRAMQEDRKAVLVLEIEPGSSRFHQVLGLAKELTSPAYADVTTVAWIPETVTGNNVVLALACNEIVMHPEAELGDIGRGSPLEPDEKQSVISLVEKRHNSKINQALVLGMLDPKAVVLKVKLKLGEGDAAVSEERVVTQDEARRLRDNNVVIEDVVTIKEAGITGTLIGKQARTLNVLVTQLADSRSDLQRLYNLPREAMRESLAAGEAPRARRIQIHGMIEPILEAFLERQIHRAVAGGANLLVFEIDSPGGYLLASENLANVIADLDPKQVRTVAYVPEQALSGAAIIALGCDEIYLHPDARLGDAGPIEIREGGQFERAPEKILSVLRETLRSLAIKKGRPPALAMAMADHSLEVYRVTHRETGQVWYMSEEELHASNGEWIKGRMVPESKQDLLLTVNGKRAHELQLAQAPVADFEELKDRIGVPADVKLTPVERTWVDTLVFLLNTQAATVLLFIAGAICIYFELYTLTGFFGIGAALCFSIFFWSRFLGGTAGWLEVVLFGLGFVLLAIELLLIPGFGVFGVSGILLLFAGLIMASQTFGDFGGGSSDFDRMTQTMGTLLTSFAAVAGIALVLSRFMPQLPILNSMVLVPPDQMAGHDPDEPRLDPSLAGGRGGSGEALGWLVGRQGAAVSVLRPAGKAEIEGRYLDVISDGPYVPQGSAIEVVSVAGNRVVVRQVDETA